MGRTEQVFEEKDAQVATNQVCSFFLDDCM